jgi:hypothetical protein
MEAGGPGLGPGVALSEVEESHLCYFVQILSTGQTGLKVEEMGEQHMEWEVVKEIAGRSHFRIGPAREKEQCGGSRQLSVGKTMKRTISGLEFLPL